MSRRFIAGLYATALALATPAAAIEPGLLTGPMAKLQVAEAPWTPSVDTFAREDSTRGRLEDYAGEIVVLNFWATWCAPCKAEMPSLQALQDRLGDEGLEVVTVAFGRHNPMQMKRFWQDAGITSLPLHLDAGTELARALGVAGLPHTLILDREGQVIAELKGEADWAAPETLALMRGLTAR
ncbi:TlpA disulfide reductase family protein [Jannaschia seohaensis]|uniref:Thiol-disulfide isomerase or thioredoxin n=1 Tax=Jannaschia seohaensis TaxID=475081 RepID=A0A2Y9A2U2_9RHOB|nr:TlpA disulfide reductase family protein [Jannaschia seohaensis]PWJ22476.1 thiol-disulfide isomerase/thioredoxin [Jannaschia seohaensis]SSA38754.1 Thiol-disulfide isomerase or thioredoxin [Jannaschia seohaensis]